MLVKSINLFVTKNITSVEMIGVILRIFSFSMVSWLGPESPFTIIWIINSIDAILLSWCSTIKKDKPYIILNVFWIIVGILGIVRSSNLFH